jgi:hypothetical protein
MTGVGRNTLNVVIGVRGKVWPGGDQEYAD